MDLKSFSLQNLFQIQISGHCGPSVIYVYRVLTRFLCGLFCLVSKPVTKTKRYISCACLAGCFENKSFDLTHLTNVCWHVGESGIINSSQVV